MGLDGVELVMAVEESFGIFLSDTETAEVVTVGGIVQLAWSKVEGQCEWSKSRVREVVHQLVRDHLGVRSCQDSDRLIEDLGME